jgi:hypothetical protein
VPTCAETVPHSADNRCLTQGDNGNSSQVDIVNPTGELSANHDGYMIFMQASPNTRLLCNWIRQQTKKSQWFSRSRGSRGLVRAGSLQRVARGVAIPVPRPINDGFAASVSLSPVPWVICYDGNAGSIGMRKRFKLLKIWNRVVRFRGNHPNLCSLPKPKKNDSEEEQKEPTASCTNAPDTTNDCTWKRLHAPARYQGICRDAWCATDQALAAKND